MSYCTDLLYGQGLTLCFPLLLLHRPIPLSLSFARGGAAGGVIDWRLLCQMRLC